MRTQFYGIVERANAIIDHFRPVARPAVLAQPRLGPPLLAKAVFAMGTGSQADGRSRGGRRTRIGRYRFAVCVRFPSARDRKSVV